MPDTPNAPKTTAPSPLRRTYVLDRSFQVRYTLLLMVVGGAASGTFGTVLYFVQRQLRSSMGLPAEVEALLSSKDPLLLGIIVVLTLLMAVGLALFGLLITHRVAGPVYVMSQYLSQLGQGRFPDFRPLRRRDELVPFFHGLQSAVVALRKQQEEDASQLERTVALLQTQATSPELHAVVEELRASSQRKRASLQLTSADASGPRGSAEGTVGAASKSTG